MREPGGYDAPLEVAAEVAVVNRGADLRVEDEAVVVPVRASCGRSKLYELIAAGEVPVIRVGRSVRVSARAIEEFVARLEAGQP
ncbi:MAG: excisionase family DNA-binding protein [Dehalococcoidia bacterium]